MWKQEYSNMFELEDHYWWYRGLHDLIELYVRRLSQKGRPRILDAGCGSGKLMTLMSRYGDVAGFDFSDDAIRYSKERGIVSVTTQDLNEWDPPCGTYDIVTCIDVLCHGAIRDVDAIVSLDENRNALGFPLSLELDSWLKDLLIRIGFSEVANLEHYTFAIEHEIKEKPISWIKEVNSEEVRELIWDQSKPMGLTNSLVWLARDFALDRNCLETATVNGQTVGVAGFWKVGTTLCISPFVTDPEKLSWTLVAESTLLR